MRVFEGIFRELQSEPEVVIFQVQGLEGMTEVEAIPFYGVQAPEQFDQPKIPLSKKTQLRMKEARLRARIGRLQENFRVSVDLSDCSRATGSTRGKAVLESVSGESLRAKFLALLPGLREFEIGPCAEFQYREKRMLVELSSHPWLEALLPQEKMGGFVCVEVIDLLPLGSKRCRVQIIDIGDA